MSQQRLTQFAPVFPVRDVKAALAHYASLGFTTRNYDQGVAFYGFADRDDVSLHVALYEEHHHHHEDEDGDHHHDEGEDHHHEFHPGVVYLYVDDADALAAEWSLPGVGGTTYPVHDTPYGLRESAHIDPDGNAIRFGSPMSTD